MLTCLTFPIIPEAINPDWFVATERFFFFEDPFSSRMERIFQVSRNLGQMCNKRQQQARFHVTFYLLNLSIIKLLVKSANSKNRRVCRVDWKFRTRSLVTLHNTCTRFQSNPRNCSLAISLSSCSPGPFAPIDRLPLKSPYIPDMITYVITSRLASVGGTARNSDRYRLGSDLNGYTYYSSYSVYVWRVPFKERR